MSDCATFQTAPADTLPESYVVACLARGEWQRALELLDELGRHPAYAPHLAAVAERLLAARNPREALTVAREAAACDDSSAAAWRAVGRACRAAGDPREAEPALRRAVELAPRENSARLALAELLLEGPRALDARPLVEEALALEPRREAARELLKRLRKSVEKSLPKSHPAGEELRKLAARLHQEGPGPRQAPAALSLCLIVKNEARNLPRVLRGARDLATEIIVVDTGSTDETVQVARRLGARVEHFEWVDDFAAARNHSLSFATGDWVLVLDADDELDANCAPALRSWLSRVAEDVSVVGLYRRYPHAGMEPGLGKDSVSVQPRLFRNGCGIRFDGAIHEQVVLPSGEPARPDTTLPVTIQHHTDAGPAAGQPSRGERNRRLLLRAVERNPGDFRSRFYLGLTCFEAGDLAEAAEQFPLVLEAAPAGADFLPKARALLASCLLELKRPGAAEEVLRQGLLAAPDHPELHFCLGRVLTSMGRLEEAVEAHERALRGRFGPGLSWHDWACRDTKPSLALCDLYLSLGNPEAAGRCLAAAERLTGPRPAYAEIRQAIEKTAAQLGREREERAEELARCEAAFAAGDAAAGLRLVTLLLEAGETTRAEQAAGAWARRAEREALAWVALGRVWLTAGAPEAALEAFGRAREADRSCLAAWQGTADARAALGDAGQAEQALLQAQALEGESGEAAEALGELYLRQERWDDAARCFQSRLDRSDDVWPAWLGLGQALLRTGKLPLAVNCFQKAATLSGGSARVRRALGEAKAYLTQAAG